MEMVSAVRGGWLWWWCAVCLCACVPVCPCTVVVLRRPSKELGRFQIAILGPPCRGTGRRGLLPGACLLLATVDGPEWIDASLASRTGNRSSRQPVALLCCGPMRHVMKRAGPKLPCLNSCIHSGSHIPIAIIAQHDTTQPNAAHRMGTGKAAAAAAATSIAARRGEQAEGTELQHE